LEDISGDLPVEPHFQDLTFDRLAIEKVLVADLDWPRHNIGPHQLAQRVIVEAISL
jgi:hypothetical protein